MSNSERNELERDGRDFRGEIRNVGSKKEAQMHSSGRRLLAIALALPILFGLLPNAHGQLATQWQTNPNAPIQPGVWFSLWNVSTQKYVSYGKRTWGINLVWQAKNERPLNFTIARSSGSSEPLRYGELIALREKTGGYLAYKQRDYGINLGWSSQPAYEWEVQGGPTGNIVMPGRLGDYPGYISDTLFALYNRSSRSFLVYGERKYGINLTWMTNTYKANGYSVRDHRSH
jgi:hypothetical protein